MHHDRFHGISRTGRRKAAAGRKQRRNQLFIEHDGDQQDPRQGEGMSFPQVPDGRSRRPSVGMMFSRCSFTSFIFTRRIFCLGIIRIRHGGICPRDRRSASHRIRLARFLTTARLWKRRLQMIPQRTPVSPSGRGSAKKVKSGSFHFSPRAFISSNSLLVLSFSTLAFLFRARSMCQMRPTAGYRFRKSSLRERVSYGLSVCGVQGPDALSWLPFWHGSRICGFWKSPTAETFFSFFYAFLHVGTLRSPV